MQLKFPVKKVTKIPATGFVLNHLLKNYFMNSKKKLAALGFTVFFFLMQYLSFAQSASYSTGNFTVNLPTLKPNEFLAQQPFYTLFIEYGDGGYFKSGMINNLDPIPPQNFPHSSRINTKYGAVVNLIGHYDTTPPPFRQILVQSISNSGPNNNSIQNTLPFDKNTGFDYSDSTIVPGDTTTMVLTYKTQEIKPSDTSTKYILAFFYNDLGVNTAGKIFSEITDVDIQYPFGSDVPNAKAIRMANSEIAYAGIPNTGIPEAVIHALRDSMGKYKNALCFKIQQGATAEEKNIFISVSTDKLTEFNFSGTSTTFKVVRIKYNNKFGNIIAHEKTSLTLPVRLYARDPNGITIYPGCLNGNPAGRRISSKITFQNDGKGPAKKVKVIVTVPDGMQFPPLNFAAALSVNGNLTFFRPPLNSYTFNNQQRQITFVMNNIKLKGTSQTTIDVERRGAIFFALKTNANPPIPICMYFDVSIIFTTEGIRDNRPVNVGAWVKSNCLISGNTCPRQLAVTR